MNLNFAGMVRHRNWRREGWQDRDRSIRQNRAQDRRELLPARQEAKG